MTRRKAPSIPDTLLDQLLSGADPKTALKRAGFAGGVARHGMLTP